MKQYPYIAKLKSDDIKMALFTGPKTATALTDNFADIKLGESDSEWDEDFYTNATHECLSKTWGLVESKEHAEFIIELANANYMDIYRMYRSGDGYFIVSGNEFLFTHRLPVVTKNYKQITIPLPPKTKEWPQVGDEVCWGVESSGVVKSLSDGFAWIKKANNDYITVYTSSLIKPKSKQDLLIEELQTKLCNNNAVDNYILACDIINGEIKGLSYELK